MTNLQLFLSFLKIGAFSFGGGYAALPLIREEVIQNHAWLSNSQFMDLITISQMTPGPIAVNSSTFIGMQIGGFFGALCATAGCILPSCLFVTFLVFLYLKYKKNTFMNGILKTLRPAVIALIAAAGVDIFISALIITNSDALKSLSGYESLSVAVLNFPTIYGIHLIQLFLFVLAFLLLRKTKINPVLIMLGCGLVAAIIEGII